VQTTGLLDLSSQRLHDRLALGLNPGTLRVSELAGHAGTGVGIDALIGGLSGDD
jgi:hypothetical protein